MIVEKLGRGKYSEVHKVVSMEHGKIYALKIIPKEGLEQDEVDVLYNEARIMEVLRHSNIIQFIEATENNDSN